MPPHLRSSIFYLLPIAFLWWRLVDHLRLEWTLNAQYSYGWAVPFLCAYLFWQRLRAGDRRSEIGVGSCSPSSAICHLPTAIFYLLFALLPLAYAPIRLIQEANPEWRLVSWALALIVLALTLLTAYAVGVRRGQQGDWRSEIGDSNLSPSTSIFNLLGTQSRIFHLPSLVFPLCFFLVAVPWPTLVEGPLIQALTRANAATTVELLGWIGVPAIPHGNVIEVSTGVVGIDDACSGIRSFQATLMISLFLGELYRLSVLRRSVLCLAGFALSFCFNVGRTSLLTWVAVRDGIGAIAKWHDPAGVTILVGCFLGLWLIALWSRKQFPDLNPNPNLNLNPLTPRHSEAAAGPPSALRPPPSGSPLRLDRGESDATLAPSPSPAGEGEGGRRPGESSRGQPNVHGEGQGVRAVGEVSNSPPSDPVPPSPPRTGRGIKGEVSNHLPSPSSDLHSSISNLPAPPSSASPTPRHSEAAAGPPSVLRPPPSGSPLRLDRGESDTTLAHPMGEGQGVRAAGEVSNSPAPNLNPNLNLNPPPNSVLRPPPSAFRFSAFLLLWLIAVEIGVEAWYRVHERDLISAVAWTVKWPKDVSGFKELAIAERSRQILRYDEGKNAQWQDNGQSWQAIYLRWNAGRIAAHLARGHTPEVCLTAAGHELEKLPGLKTVTVKGLSLPFRGYSFHTAQGSVFVFYCLWEDQKPAQAFDTERLSYDSRFAAVRAGRRNLGQRSLEVLVSGMPDAAAAETALATQLDRLIVLSR